MDEEPRLSRRRLLAGAGLAASGALAGCTLGTPQTTQDAPEGSETFPTSFDSPTQTPELAQESELSSLYSDVVDSVAAVRIESAEGRAGGTAWVYDHAAGNYLVTNEHVVGDSETVYVWFNESGWREGTVVGTDIHSDLAVIEVLDGMPEASTGLPLVEEPVPVGTEVAVIGNPFDLTGSFTTGVVSGRNRNIDLRGRTFSIADGIQTDAAVNSGNSGGPLLTVDQQVAGVINAGISNSNNIGFAISARMARRVIPELIQDGEFRHSRMGVLLTDVTPEIIEANDLSTTWGVYVVEAQSGLPAAGVLQGSTGDAIVRGREVPVGGDVITKLANNGTEWSTPTTERLSAFLALHTRPGDTIDVTVERDGEEQTVELTLTNREGTTAGR
jgi:serine protease Do